MLSPVFSKNMCDDVVYLVFQHMPSEEFMETLVNCLKEEISRNLVYITDNAEFSPGNVYFLSNHYLYMIDGNWIKLCPPGDKPNAGHNPIDLLLSSAADSIHFSTVIILSGVLLDRDGIEGIQKLKQKGARVLATSKTHTPVCNMAEDLQKLNLIDEYYPPASLLANLEFIQEQSLGVLQDRWLVVDDETEVREIIGNILHFEKIKCDFARDGLDALRKIQKIKYSGLILDIKMPELDGLQTLRALQTIDPDIPTLIVTGYDDAQTREASRNPNVAGILLKPFTGEDVKRYLPKMHRKL